MLDYLIDMVEYVGIISNKCVTNMLEKHPPQYNSSKNKLIKDTETNHLDYKDHVLIASNNYSAVQLKQFLKNHNLKTSGKKIDLQNRLYSFLFLSDNAILIQKNIRRHFVKMFMKCKGPAIKNRSLCVNDTDFLTLENMNDIDIRQFVSFKDEDDFIYGFDVLSFHNLIKNKQYQNPYNRKELTKNTMQDFTRLINLSELLGFQINICIQNEYSKEQTHELKILDLFQTINALGNYSESYWFTSLNKIQLIRFLKELLEIWNYRSQISEITKRQICHPHGNPFRQINMSRLYNENDLLVIQKEILGVLENMVINGVDQDSKSLGAYYVLGGLTLVNTQAAIAMPWLYQSFLYH